MRRPAPRPLGVALGKFARDRTPASVLGRVQLVWAEVAGAAVAEEAQPVSEREGTLTVRCHSAVWAQELTLLAADLKDRLNGRLEGQNGIRALRFVVGEPSEP